MLLEKVGIRGKLWEMKTSPRQSLLLVEGKHSSTIHSTVKVTYNKSLPFIYGHFMLK